MSIFKSDAVFLPRIFVRISFFVSSQEREVTPNLRGELPKTSAMQPNDATHTVER